KMSVLRKWLLTLWVGGTYKPPTQRGRRAAGAKKFALVLSKRAAQATLDPAEAKCGKPVISRLCGI
ncbi:hypothetical protein, partial [Hoeflea sp. BAL378]|uniref:hypothetical protein n=1 Tax=Hoeflea sp. BAL378 TaxID=1547437 RepID=UPI001AEC1A1C